MYLYPFISVFLRQKKKKKLIFFFKICCKNFSPFHFFFKFFSYFMMNEIHKDDSKRYLVDVLKKIQNSEDITLDCQKISSKLEDYCELAEFYQLPFDTICSITENSETSADVYKTIIAKCSIHHKQFAPLLLKYIPLINLTYEECVSIIGSLSCSGICMKLKELYNEDQLNVTPDITFQISEIQNDIKELKDYVCKNPYATRSLNQQEIPQCNFLQTGKTYIKGKFYKCKTCGGSPRHSICPECAKICHEGHELEPHEGKYYCDCGAHALSCQCKLVPDKLECTFSNTPRNGYVTGIYYQCQTCGGPDDHTICPACAKICHQGHVLTQHQGQYYCDCGSHRLFSCKLIPR